MVAGVARTRAVVVRRAMEKWYHPLMPSTTDVTLRELAENDLAQAQQIMGIEPVVGLWVVGGDFWDGFADKARRALEKAVKLPWTLGSKAGTKIRDAVRRGMSKASEATDGAREKLAAVAAAAGALSLGTLILPGLLVFLLLERSGWGGRARRAGRRYVEGRARSYGF